MRLAATMPVATTPLPSIKPNRAFSMKTAAGRPVAVFFAFLLSSSP
jgi:hypothetical protein